MFKQNIKNLNEIKLGVKQLQDSKDKILIRIYKMKYKIIIIYIYIYIYIYIS